MASPRCAGDGLPDRDRRQLGRPQGPSRGQLPGRLALRRRRRAYLSHHRRTDPGSRFSIACANVTITQRPAGPTGRMYMDVAAAFSRDATIYHDDPAIGPAEGRPGRSAIMGDIVHLPEGSAEDRASIFTPPAAIERVDIFNGLDHVETIRPYGPDELGNRVRVLWEGAEYRGRFRQVIWDGSAVLSDNRIEDAAPINFFNHGQDVGSSRRQRPRVEGPDHREHRRIRRLAGRSLRRHPQTGNPARTVRHSRRGNRIRGRDIRPERRAAPLFEGVPPAGAETRTAG